jgi:hypothetical protein
MVPPSATDHPLAFTAPRRMDKDLSGKIKSGSGFMNTLKPVHVGHAPNGLFKGKHPRREFFHADTVFRHA